jgi:hypothetical protein
VPADHPLRAIRVHANQALRQTSRVFNAMLADGGRISAPPETRLMSALLMTLDLLRAEPIAHRGFIRI